MKNKIQEKEKIKQSPPSTILTVKLHRYDDVYEFVKMKVNKDETHNCFNFL